MDLTGWSIIPYNESNRFRCLIYSIGALSGIIPNQSNGFGTVFVAINGFTKWFS
jgi:hypothetical protein